MENNVTVKQLEALRKLIAMEPFSALPRTKLGGIKTGLHSQTLANLLEIKAIDCTTVWVRGIVTSDLQVTPFGRQLVAGAR